MRKNKSREWSYVPPQTQTQEMTLRKIPMEKLLKAPIVSYTAVVSVAVVIVAITDLT